MVNSNIDDNLEDADNDDDTMEKRGKIYGIAPELEMYHTPTILAISAQNI